ncbi:MAG: N-6 DNA methylase [Promethearchaeia archaeon]
MYRAYIKFLLKSGILEELKNENEYGESSHFQKITSYLEDSNKLHNLYEEFAREPSKYIDFFSFLYQKIIPKSEREDLGEFYTPIAIINYILDVLGYFPHQDIENLCVIDPSCGSGSFLIQVIKRLIQRFTILYDIERIQQFTPSQAKTIIKNIRERVFGIDLNPIACFLCELNIYYALFDLISLILQEDPGYIPERFHIYHMNSLKLLDTPNLTFPSEGFDIVLGNPPYVFIRGIPAQQKRLIDSSDFKTNKGQYDYYQIFVELGIRLLTQGGKLGYIVPDSLLALSNRKIIRKYIMDHTKIKEINHVGEKFQNLSVSNIIIILKKENSYNLRRDNYISIKTSQHKTKLKQKRFKDWDYRFLINLNEKDISLLNHLNKNFPKIKDLIDRDNIAIKLQRGVEIGKDGKIFYCSICKKYYPLPKRRNNLSCKICDTNIEEKNIERIIVDEIPVNSNANYLPFVYAINRYYIEEYKYINKNKNGINYKPLNLYRNRILIRQISENNMICATYDENLSLTTQSIYNLKIRGNVNDNHYFNHYYLLGLLNSELLSYYFLKSFGSYKLLFPRILIEKIKELPIVVPKSKREKKIAEKLSKCVKEVLKMAKNKSEFEEKSRKKLNQIEQSIYELYGIQKKLYIHSFFNDLRKKSPSL